MLVCLSIAVGAVAIWASAANAVTPKDVVGIPAAKAHGPVTQRLATTFPPRHIDQGLPLGFSLVPDGHMADLHPWRPSGFHVAAGEQTVDVVPASDTPHGGSGPLTLSPAGRMISVLAVIGWARGIGKRASFGVDAGMSAVHVGKIVGLPAAGEATRAGAITSVHIGMRF